LPLLAALEDGFTQAAARRHQGDLLLACSLEDVVVLRACGLAATLAVGLEALKPADVRRLSHDFGWGMGKSEREFDEGLETEDASNDSPAPPVPEVAASPDP